MWRQSAGKVGVCHSVLPFSPSANHLLYSLGEYTSFVIVCNSFCALRQRWVIPYLHFKIRRLQIRIPSFPTFEPFSSGFLLLNFGELSFFEMSFFWHCRFRQIPQCLSRARVTVNSMGETPVPPFFFSGALTPGEGPLFKINIRFTRPRPCL